MNKISFSILLIGGIICTVFAACTGGAYDASPNSNANYVVNPLEPLKASDFTWSEGTTPALWSGKGVIGGVIDGSAWSSSTAYWVLDSGSNNIYGSVGSTLIYLHLGSVYATNIYSMGFQQYNQSCTYSDSSGSAYYQYYSYNGNSGEVYITENDSAYIKGQFYCECISTTGQIVAINNGYFNISKP